MESTACLAEAEAASLDNHARKCLVLLPRKEPLGLFWSLPRAGKGHFCYDGWAAGSAIRENVP